MDFRNAAMLVVGVYGLVWLVKNVLPGSVGTVKITDSPKVVVGLVFLCAITAVFVLAAAQTFGHQQVVGGKPLDQLGFADKLVVAFFLGALAAGFNEASKVVANIGSPIPTATQQAAIDAQAQRILDKASQPAIASVPPAPPASITPHFPDDQPAVSV